MGRSVGRWRSGPRLCVSESTSLRQERLCIAGYGRMENNWVLDTLVTRSSRENSNIDTTHVFIPIIGVILKVLNVLTTGKVTYLLLRDLSSHSGLKVSTKVPCINCKNGSTTRPVSEQWYLVFFYCLRGDIVLDLTVTRPPE